MSVELQLQAIQTIAVVVGIIFGLVQLRQIREQREVQAGAELLRLLQSPDMADTVLLIHSLSDQLPGKELKEWLGDEFRQVLALLAMFESLGPLVARGHVPIEMYAEFYRGPTMITWAKLERYIKEQRAAGWPTLFEWLEWLADRMKERSQDRADEPAFERFRDWKSPSDYQRLSRQ
jgi:hypothetical protein